MAADKGPLHQFEISSLYEIRLEDIDISFTNSALSMVLSTFVATVIFYLGSRKNPNIPGRLQVLVEMSYDFVGKVALSNYVKNNDKKNIYRVFFGDSDLKIKGKPKCFYKKKEIGSITSVIFSPKYKKNLGFMIAYENDIFDDNSNNYFVKSEYGLIEATISNFN